MANNVITVTFPDGTLFSSDQNQMDQAKVIFKTVKKLIQKFGIDKVLKAEQQMKRRSSEDRLISTDPGVRDTDKRTISRKVIKVNDIEYAILGDYNVAEKASLLKRISSELNAGLKVCVSYSSTLKGEDYEKPMEE